MADTATAEAETEPEAKSGGLKPIIFGVLGALVAGGGGFFATYSGIADGLLSGLSSPSAPKVETAAFVPLDPLIVSLGQNAQSRQLRFSAQLEVDPVYKEEVAALTPRVFDVLNTFLRAVDEAELEDPTAMVRLRAQMLRRIQVVTGEGRVKDLLIMEFVLN